MRFNDAFSLYCHIIINMKKRELLQNFQLQNVLLAENSRANVVKTIVFPN